MVKRTGKFALLVQEAMKDQSMSLKDLNESLGITYEHVRKIVKGLTIPSAETAKKFAEVLKLNIKELVDTAMEDKLISKFGSVASKVAGRNPELDPIDAVWDLLTPDDKQEIFGLVNMKANHRRANQKRKVRGA